MIKRKINGNIDLILDEPGEVFLDDRDNHYYTIIRQEAAAKMWPLLKHFAEKGNFPATEWEVTAPDQPPRNSHELIQQEIGGRR